MPTPTAATLIDAAPPGDAIDVLPEMPADAAPLDASTAQLTWVVSPPSVPTSTWPRCCSRRSISTSYARRRYETREARAAIRCAERDNQVVCNTSAYPLGKRDVAKITFYEGGAGGYVARRKGSNLVVLSGIRLTACAARRQAGRVPEQREAGVPDAAADDRQGHRAHRRGRCQGRAAYVRLRTLRRLTDGAGGWISPDVHEPVSADVVEKTITSFTRLDQRGDKKAMNKLAQRLQKEQPFLLQHAAAVRSRARRRRRRSGGVLRDARVGDVRSRPRRHPAADHPAEPRRRRQGRDRGARTVEGLADKPVHERVAPALVETQPHIYAKLAELLAEDVKEAAMTPETAARSSSRPKSSSRRSTRR